MSDPAIELRGVTVHRDGRPVLEGVDLCVERGEVVSILGPNGGGKTTLLRVILGLLRPDAGTVRVLGTTPEGARGRVGYVPQQRDFDLGFPIRVLDVVCMGRLRGRVLRRGRRRREADRAAAREALERMEVAALADRPIGALSGGQLQRVLIARALAQEPELLLLDEPTASLDERVGRSVWELLDPLSGDMTVVVVSHDVGAISRYVKRVACLNVRLHEHPSGELSSELLEHVYGCPVDLLAHGHPHRVLAPHTAGGSEPS